MKFSFTRKEGRTLFADVQRELRMSIRYLMMQFPEMEVWLKKQKFSAPAMNSSNLLSYVVAALKIFHLDLETEN